MVSVPGISLTPSFPLCYKHNRNPIEEAFFPMQLAKNLGYYLGFVATFRGLKKPAITMHQIKEASLEDLRTMRREAEAIEYRSPEAMEEIIREYVKAQPRWTSLLERAIT